jgi:hypothetical protein
MWEGRRFECMIMAWILADAGCRIDFSHSYQRDVKVNKTTHTVSPAASP